MIRWRSQVWLVAAAAAGLVLGGCQRTLFTEKLPRSQYERYAELRGKPRVTAEDVPYGFEQPALRERLRPLEAP